MVEELLSSWRLEKAREREEKTRVPISFSRACPQ
jgi:hypothetical protein